MTIKEHYVNLNISMKCLVKIHKGYLPVKDLLYEISCVMNDKFEMKDEPRDGSKPENYWLSCLEVDIDSIGQEEQKHVY